MRLKCYHSVFMTPFFYPLLLVGKPFHCVINSIKSFIIESGTLLFSNSVYLHRLAHQTDRTTIFHRILPPQVRRIFCWKTLRYSTLHKINENRFIYVT
jgi:hypothetical protein